MSSEENPSYYSILPAKVRYAKINPMARLLYSEITALSNVYGYCTAGNDFFAGSYDIAPETAIGFVSLLEEKGFIRIEYEIKGSKVMKRKIYPLVF